MLSRNAEIMTQNLALAKCLLHTHSKCSLSKKTPCADDNYWSIGVYIMSVLQLEMIIITYILLFSFVYNVTASYISGFMFQNLLIKV